MAEEDVSVPYCENVIMKINTMRKQSMLTDIVLLCGGKEFEAHRNILSAASEYLYHIFTSDMNERVKPTVELPYIQPHSLEVILDILYTGTLLPVNFNQLPDLISALHLMQLHSLYQYYREMLLIDLGLNNFLIYWQLGEALKDTEILLRVYGLIDSIYMLPEFKSVDPLWLRNLFRQISTKSNHDLLLKIILQISGREETYPPVLNDLIEYVDFQKASNSMLSDCVQHPLLVKCDKFKDNCLPVASQRLYFLEISKAFNSLPHLFVLGEDQEGNSIVQKCHLGEWENEVTLLEMPLDNAELLVTPSNYKLINISSNDNCKGILQLSVFDKQWQKIKTVELGGCLANFTVEAAEFNDILIVRLYQGYLISDFLDCGKESSCRFMKLHSDDNILKLEYVVTSTGVFMAKKIKTPEGKIVLQIFKLSGPENNYQWHLQGDKEWDSEDSNWFSYFYPPDLIVLRYFPGRSVYFNLRTKTFEVKQENNGLKDVLAVDIFRWNVVCLTEDGWIHFQDMRESRNEWKTLTKCPMQLSRYFKITIDNSQ